MSALVHFRSAGRVAQLADPALFADVEFGAVT